MLQLILDPVIRGENLYPLLHQLRTLAPISETEPPGFQQAWVITRFSDDDTVVRSKSLSSDQRVLEVFNTIETAGGVRGVRVTGEHSA